MYNTTFLLKYMVFIPFNKWFYVWCGILIYYVRCSGYFFCLFRFGASGRVIFSSSSTNGARGGAFRVMAFVVVPLG